MRDYSYSRQEISETDLARRYRLGLALWLALKLTARGYRVWLDQLKLLGGEPFPTDIDEAIRNRTFRMISLLSHDAMDKPSPRGERTLAVNVGSELGIDVKGGKTRSELTLPWRRHGGDLLTPAA